MVHIVRRVGPDSTRTSQFIEARDKKSLSWNVNCKLILMGYRKSILPGKMAWQLQIDTS